MGGKEQTPGPVSYHPAPRGSRPHRNPDKGKAMLTPQRFDRLVYRTIRDGADTTVKLVLALEDFDPTDIRHAFERLKERGKISVEKGTGRILVSKSKQETKR